MLASAPPGRRQVGVEVEEHEPWHAAPVKELIGEVLRESHPRLVRETAATPPELHAERAEDVDACILAGNRRHAAPVDARNEQVAHRVHAGDDRLPAAAAGVFGQHDEDDGGIGHQRPCVRRMSCTCITPFWYERKNSADCAASGWVHTVSLRPSPAGALRQRTKPWATESSESKPR